MEFTCSKQWFEYIDCKKDDCNSPKYGFLFIANNERYRPLLNTGSALLPHNKLQYLSTYRLNKQDLVNERKYICMVRNQNGFNYKIMTLTVNDQPVKGSLTTYTYNYETATIIIVSSIVVLILFTLLVAVIVLIGRSKRNQKANKQCRNKLNNLDTMTRTRSQNDYLNFTNQTNQSDQSNRNNKALQDKWKGSTFLINNLIQTGRSSNQNNIDTNYSTLFLNKYSRSKVSSVSNSFHRLNNTPVQDDSSISFQNI